INDYFKYSSIVEPIKLGYSVTADLSDYCTSLGYGPIWSNPLAPEMQHLYYATMYVNQCGSVTPPPPGKTLCAISLSYGVGLCEGDRGAPLVCR
ncbi:Protein of unknown function, partial [Gryllus bimaculatus]